MWKFKGYVSNIRWCTNSVGSGSIKYPDQDFSFVSFDIVI